MPNDLSNIKPKEISLVDKPANKKDFLFFKSEKGGKMPDGAEGLNLSEVPAGMIKKFIEEMKPSVEKLVSITTNLEALQKEDGSKEGDSKDDVSKEFAGIQKSLNELVEKCSLIEKNSKETNMPDGDNKGDKKTDVPEEFAKTMEAFTKKIDGLSDKIEKMEKDAKEKDEKKDDKADDDVKKDDKKDDKDDKKDDKNIDVDAVVEKVVGKVEKVVLEKVEKALDKRALSLVGMFSEAAKEEFKVLFDGVAENKNELSKFKKALSGGEPEEDEGGEDYVRTYGNDEREGVASVEHKDNPFHGMFSHIDARTS